MIELEVLVEVFSTCEEAEKSLANCCFEKKEHIKDVYFYDPIRPNLKPDKSGKTYESFRIRKKNNEIKITYKKDVYDNGIWQFSDEHEARVYNEVEVKRIIKLLGLKRLVEIDNYREYYSFDNYKIVLERVKNLGVFLEVEYMAPINEEDVATKRKEIQEFIKKLGLNTSEELNCGKPELYMKRNNIKL